MPCFRPVMVVFVILLAAAQLVAQHQAKQSVAAKSGGKEQDGLIGPVRRVRIETAKLLISSGKLVEGPRTLLATATYDFQGNKLDGAYYPLEGDSAAGREEYKYDDKGNITEMISRDDEGHIIGREIYTYKFDQVGNWTKMTTLAEVIEDGKASLEPLEVTYRFITYYLSGDVARKALPATPTTTKGVAVANTGGNHEAEVQITAEGAASTLRMSPETPRSPAPSGATGDRVGSLPTSGHADTAGGVRAADAVSVEVAINRSGEVVSARALSGPKFRLHAAEAAARQARFAPTLLSEVMDGEGLNAVFNPDEFMIETLKVDDVAVRVLGKRAVVKGRVTVSGQYKGNSITRQALITQVLELGQGRWQVVGTVVEE